MAAGQQEAKSAQSASGVTKSDSTVLKNVVALYIGGTGDVNIMTKEGTTVLFVGVPAGTILPIAPSKVMSTSTTATSIVALRY